MNVDYIKYGNTKLPASKTQKGKHQLSRFGYAYLRHLKKNKRGIYSGMILSGKLTEHVEDIDKQAMEMYEDIIRQRIGDAPPRENQMEWVAFMNNLRHSAEEIVYREIIYESETRRNEGRER